MKYKLIADIAIALSVARWRQTLVAAIGVTFSITMFITLLSFMNGLNGMLDGLILNRTPHIKLYNLLKATPDQPIQLASGYKDHYHFIRSVKPNAGRSEIYNVGPIMKKIVEDDRVLGLAPKISTQVFYTIGAVDLAGIINGVDVEAENKLYYFSTYLTSGNYIDLKNIPNSIILGKAAADQMLAKIGDVIQVTSVTGEKQQLKVVGYFQSGLNDIDKVQSYTSLNTAQKLLGESRNYITDLQVKLKDIDLAPAMAKEYSTLFSVDAEDIQTANAQFETGSNVRSMISYSVGITLLIVAGFGIYNILNMMIYEKMDSIAIMKATGFSGRDVKSIFIMISLSIGVFGVAFGLLFGYGMSSIIDQIPFNTAALPSIKTFPVDYNPKFYIIGATFGIFTTYIAGYLPSRKASKVDPVVIIRGNNMSKKVLEAIKINKYFYTAQTQHVLKDVSFSVHSGEFASIVGKSGCGKSTLLYILSTMDTDYTGDLYIDGNPMRLKTEAELARVRNEKIGFVFQFHYLLNEFSVLRNVMIPGLKLGKYSEKELEHRAMEKLKIFGIEDQARKMANQLSGGQKQRVAIARALINDPLIIMGDEPTGNLDKKNSEIVFELFQKLAREFHQTLLIVTHDMEFAQATDRVIEMDDGRIVKNEK